MTARGRDYLSSADEAAARDALMNTLPPSATPVPRSDEPFAETLTVAAIDWDYDQDGFLLNLRQWGPYLGLAFVF